MKLREDGVDFLKKVSDKKLFIVTSNTKSNILKTLKNSNLAESLFLKVLGKENKHSKTEKILDLKNEFNLNLDKTIFITDSLGDILEGQKAGVKNIAVT
jgi:HAD superfamily hydrolase (TIGR01549 family)